MARCEICGKGPRFGHNVSHAQNKTNRRWLPNIQKHTIFRDGKPVQVRICQRCLRTITKRLASR